MQVVLDSTNARLETIVKDIQEVKVILQFTKKHVDDLKKSSTKLTENSNIMQADIFKVCDSLLTLTDKMEYVKGQTRRNNLVFDGVAESPGETWADTEQKSQKSWKRTWSCSRK